MLFMSVNMKPNMKTYALTPLLILAAISAASAAPVTAVHFESNHGSNSNSGLRHSVNPGAWTDTTGDFDGSGTTDYSRLLPLSRPGVFIDLPETIPGRNTRIHAGARTINFGATGFTNHSLMRYGGGNPGFLQVANLDANATTKVALAFAPHVRKSDFLNGADAASSISFADQADGFQANLNLSGTTVEDGIRRGRLLVQNGSNWYISESLVPTQDTLSVNPYTETWHLIDAAELMYTEDAGSVPDSTSSFLGSSLTDIQALGVLMINMVDGTDGQTKSLSTSEFSAVVIAEEPAPPPKTFTAVYFESDHDANINSVLRQDFSPSAWVDTTGDFNGNGMENDWSTFLPISAASEFIIDLPETIPGRNTIVHAGARMINFGATNYADFEILRYSGTGRALQAGSPLNATAELGFAFAPHVRKSNFLDGVNTADNVSFADQAGGFRAKIVLSGTPLAGKIRRARLLVQNGADWYISGTLFGSTGGEISTNPYTDTWYLLDEAKLMYTEGPGQVPDSTSSVAGSTLTDIQALGVLIINTVDGTTTQQKSHSVTEIFAAVHAEWELPKLTIESVGENQMRLAWPAAAEGWTLESAAELEGVFSDAGLEVTVENDENAAYDTVTSPRGFYRLRLED